MRVTNAMINNLFRIPAKGQLISECLFDVSNFPKKQTKTQTMTEAEHNRPNPKFFDNRPSALAMEVFGEKFRPIVSPKTSVAKAEGRLSKTFEFGRLYSASVIVCTVLSFEAS